MLQLFRLIKIIFIILRFRLDNLISTAFMPWWIRWPLYIAPWRIISCHKSRAIRLRLAFESLGPVFVKFGQLLSTRPDLLPDDIVAELSKLQDQVPPFPVEQAVNRIETSLKKKVPELFKTFDRTPLASASVAQVHAAVLHGGERVIVKIIRPKIKQTIRQDMKLLYSVSKILMGFSSDIRRLRLKEVVSDYEKTLLDELNLMREAANASQLRRNFPDSPDIYIPAIHWEYCSENVMVMERITGIPVSDTEKLKALGTNIKKLAERAVKVFFTQVFRDGFFHADMHPGNILVNADNPDDPYFIAIDFGIVGSLNPEDQSYLARNVLAFFHQDYRKVAELHISSGWVPHKTQVQELEAAIRTVCEPVFGRPLQDISFGQVLIGLFQTARRFDMEVQPQLVLLEKTLLNVEGIGRQLYPQLNLWSTAQPFLEQWLRKRVSPKGVVNRIHQNMPDWIEQLPLVTKQIMNNIQKASIRKKFSFPRKILRLSGVVLLLFSGLCFYYPASFLQVYFFPVLLGFLGLFLILAKL